jgi:hypothetical protein
MVLNVDGKSHQIQALDRTQPGFAFRLCHPTQNYKCPLIHASPGLIR